MYYVECFKCRVWIKNFIVKHFFQQKSSSKGPSWHSYAPSMVDLGVKIFLFARLKVEWERQKMMMGLTKEIWIFIKFFCPPSTTSFQRHLLFVPVKKNTNIQIEYSGESPTLKHQKKFNYKNYSSRYKKLHCVLSITAFFMVFSCMLWDATCYYRNVTRTVKY